MIIFKCPHCDKELKIISDEDFKIIKGAADALQGFAKSNFQAPFSEKSLDPKDKAPESKKDKGPIIPPKFAGPMEGEID